MNLERAIVIATNAHSGQLDKGGSPYILHPLRIMLNMTSDESRITAVLHDVVEDTEVTLNDLRNEGFSEEVLSAIDQLTRRDNESYMQFIRRIKENDLAKMVKIADIEDNKNLSRIPDPTDADMKRVKKYEKALKELMS